MAIRGVACASHRTLATPEKFHGIWCLLPLWGKYLSPKWCPKSRLWCLLVVLPIVKWAKSVRGPALTSVLSFDFAGVYITISSQSLANFGPVTRRTGACVELLVYHCRGYLTPLNQLSGSASPESVGLYRFDPEQFMCRLFGTEIFWGQFLWRQGILTLGYFKGIAFFLWRWH